MLQRLLKKAGLDLVCANCGDIGETEAAHVIPRSLGGVGTVPLCPPCHGLQHSMKRNQNIRELTKMGLARRKAAGLHVGRPVAPEAKPARDRMKVLLLEGVSLKDTAAQLNSEGFKTPTGLSWTWRHVQKARSSLELEGHEFPIIRRPNRKG